MRSWPYKTDCANCPFAKDGRPNKPVHAEVPTGEPYGVLVGEGPGHDEVTMGRPFVGMTGQKLDVELEGAKLDRRRLLVINATACYPTTKTATAMRQAVKCCAPAFEAQMQKVPAGLPVFAMGAHAAGALGIRAKVGVARGFIRPMAWRGGSVIITWHPTDAFFRAPKEHGAFSIDLRRFRRLVGGHTVYVPKVVTSPTVKQLGALYYAGATLGCDIETGPATMEAPWTGKDPTRARLKTIAFSDGGTTVAVLWAAASPGLKNLVEKILAEPSITKVFHNGFYFDGPVLKRHGMEVVRMEDTRDMRRALSSTSKVSLRHCVSLYMDFIPWKETDDEDAEKMYETNDVEALLQYNGYDAYVTKMVYDAMWRELNEQDQADQEPPQQDPHVQGSGVGPRKQARKRKAERACSAVNAQ